MAARGQEKRIPFTELQIVQVAKDSRHDELALLPAKRVGKLKLANKSHAGLLPLRLPQRPYGKADQTGRDMAPSAATSAAGAHTLCTARNQRRRLARRRRTWPPDSILARSLAIDGFSATHSTRSGMAPSEAAASRETARLHGSAQELRARFWRSQRLCSSPSRESRFTGLP